jgi:hypothetical protein
MTCDGFDAMRSPKGSLQAGSPQQVIDKILEKTPESKPCTTR